MIIASTWLTKLLLSHLLTDFMLQPSDWVEDRKQKHFRSPKLYLHGLLTGLMVFVLLGWQYWIVAGIIMITHIIIDGWKSYQQNNMRYFLADQLLHLAVIAGCWYVSFVHWQDVVFTWQQLHTNYHAWKILTAVIFLTTPAGILIGKFTKQWQDKIDDGESLANAGKWIGIAERIIVFILVLHAQYAAIGLLVTAKGIIRFNEKDRQETKTEYLVIGTLVSIGLAMVTGLLVKS
jgi:hypothetical protein